MKQGECWCNSKKVEWYLWDQDHQEVLGLDGVNAMLRVRISPKQGRIGIPIDFCPYCGRRLASGEPRCPQKEHEEWHDNTEEKKSTSTCCQLGEPTDIWKEPEEKPQNAELSTKHNGGGAA